jgi:hypothetical protein
VNYSLLIALGLLCIALSNLLTQPRGQLFCVALALVLFALASVAALTGPEIVTLR